MSTDKSLSILNNISSSKLKIFRNEVNSGLFKTRLVLTQKSKGKYLLSLDPDDELMCGLLETIYPYLKNETYDMLQYFHIVVTKKCTFRAQQLPAKDATYDREALLKLNWTCWSAWRYCTRRSILLKSFSVFPDHLYRLVGSEDLAIFFSVILLCKSYRIIDYYGYIYYYTVPPRSILAKRDRSWRKMAIFAKNLWKKHNLTNQFYNVN